MVCSIFNFFYVGFGHSAWTLNVAPSGAVTISHCSLLILHSTNNMTKANQPSLIPFPSLPFPSSSVSQSYYQLLLATHLQVATKKKREGTERWRLVLPTKTSPSNSCLRPDRMTKSESCEVLVAALLAFWAVVDSYLRASDEESSRYEYMSVASGNNCDVPMVGSSNTNFFVHQTYIEYLCFSQQSVGMLTRKDWKSMYSFISHWYSMPDSNNV